MKNKNITLADAIAITDVLPMPNQARQGSSRSIKRLCGYLKKDPDDVSGSLSELNNIFGKLNGEAFGIAPNSFDMMCSDIRRAVKATNDCEPATIDKAKGLQKKDGATLADVIEVVKLQKWDTTATRNAIAAINKFSAALNHTPASLPANLSRTDHLIYQKVTYLTLGVSKATFGSMRSRLRSAIKLMDHGTKIRASQLTG
ncbi:MAG: hypothetical protein KAQ66_12325, partial [Rhodospirillaceae bacterium]|nr:hypothetical protein [Rhodospirillaceae bacterium]